MGGFGQWQLKDGVWISKNDHNTQARPTSHLDELSQGKAPNWIVRSGTTEKRKLDNLRKFDKPSEHQIKQLEKEDEEAARKRLDVTPVVHETKRDLESGKIRVHPGVLRNLNKKYYEKVVPFTSVEEGGITHIIPQQDEPITTTKSPEELYSELKKKFESQQEEKVIASIGRSEPGGMAPPIEEKDLIEGSIQSVKVNRAKFRGRTIT